jgi:hypothetical protein
MEYIVKVLVAAQGSRINMYHNRVITFPLDQKETWPSKRFLDFHIRLAESNHLEIAKKQEKLRKDQLEKSLAGRQKHSKVWSFLESLHADEVPME